MCPAKRVNVYDTFHYSNINERELYWPQNAPQDRSVYLSKCLAKFVVLLNSVATFVAFLQLR